MVDLLVGSERAQSIAARLKRCDLHVPAHFDAEVLAAFGRLARAGLLSEVQVSERIDRVVQAPIERHPLPGLLIGAWGRRHNLRLVDSLYVELAAQLDSALITTDAALAATTEAAELL